MRFLLLLSWISSAYLLFNSVADNNFQEKKSFTNCHQLYSSKCLKKIKFLTNTGIRDTATLLQKLGKDKTESITEEERSTKELGTLWA